MNPDQPQRDLSGPKDPPLSDVLRFKIAELSICLEHNHVKPSPSSLQHHLSDLLDGQFKTATVLLLNQLNIASIVSNQPLTAAQICSQLQLNTTSSLSTKFQVNTSSSLSTNICSSSQEGINTDCLERLLRYAASLNLVHEVNKDNTPAFLKTSSTERIARNPINQDQSSFYSHLNPVLEILQEFLFSNENEERITNHLKDQHEYKLIQKYLRSMKTMNIQENLFPLISSIAKHSMGTSIVDISGGAGECMFHLKNSFKNLRCIVFDLKQEVESYTASAEVDFIPGDVFNEEEIPEADIYLLRRVLQKYSDQDCCSLLSNLYQRLRPGGLLITVSQHVPDWGEVNWRDGGSLCMDLRMMTMGVERRARTEGDLRMLMQKCGFVIGARHVWEMEYGGRLSCMTVYKQ